MTHDQDCDSRKDATTLGHRTPWRKHGESSSAGNINANVRYEKPKPEAAGKCCQQLFLIK